MFRHVKIDYDPSIDWEPVCIGLFRDDRKYLCVAEKLDVNAHVHMQGETNLAVRDFDKLCRELLKGHYKLQDPKARPIRAGRKTTDEKGFQYMCKENPVGNRQVLARNMFTDEELLELYQKSECYVKELKEGLRNYLYDKVETCEPPTKLRKLYQRAGCKYYKEQDKMPPPNFQKHILWAMYHAIPPSEAREDYVSETI